MSSEAGAPRGAQGSSRLARVGHVVDRHQIGVLLAAIALGVAIRVFYVVVVANDLPLAGDLFHYDAMARLMAEGRWMWGLSPTGVPHPTMWKPPGYPTWLGAWYSVLGAGPTRVGLVQVLTFGPATIALSWTLARRLLGPRVAAATAFLVAVYPMAWQFEGLLYSESLAVPLFLLALVLGLGREPTARRAAVIGVVVGISLLVRPTGFTVVAGLAVGWLVLSGWRPALEATVVTVAFAALVISPWTIRNYALEGAFVPLSVQDAAVSGTFNEEAASDPRFPYGWRPLPARDREYLLNLEPGTEESEVHEELVSRARAYIADHPEALLESFYWNGLTRLWDVRRPSNALIEVEFEGRSRKVTIAGLAMYYVILPLALLGLWRLRRRREIVLPLLTIALAMSVVYTVASGTRYRAPMEPVLAMLACAAVLVPRSRAAGAAGPGVADPEPLRRPAAASH